MIKTVVTEIRSSNNEGISLLDENDFEEAIPRFHRALLGPASLVRSLIGCLEETESSSSPPSSRWDSSFLKKAAFVELRNGTVSQVKQGRAIFRRPVLLPFARLHTISLDEFSMLCCMVINKMVLVHHFYAIASDNRGVLARALSFYELVLQLASKEESRKATVLFHMQRTKQAKDCQQKLLGLLLGTNNGSHPRAGDVVLLNAFPLLAISAALATALAA